VEQIDLVNGQGEVVHLKKGTDELDAAGVSMGLFGIVTGVTLRVGPRYFVVRLSYTRRLYMSSLIN
jgi:FAD/FMN-containing dehydrogenase